MVVQINTTATPRETQVTAQRGVVYRVADLGGSHYVVTPHPPTPRDKK